jgi:hypothetical protein
VGEKFRAVSFEPRQIDHSAVTWWIQDTQAEFTVLPLADICGGMFSDFSGLQLDDCLYK